MSTLHNDWKLIYHFFALGNLKVSFTFGSRSEMSKETTTTFNRLWHAFHLLPRYFHIFSYFTLKASCSVGLCHCLDGGARYFFIDFFITFSFDRRKLFFFVFMENISNCRRRLFAVHSDSKRNQITIMTTEVRAEWHTRSVRNAQFNWEGLHKKIEKVQRWHMFRLLVYFFFFFSGNITFSLQTDVGFIIALSADNESEIAEFNFLLLFYPFSRCTTKATWGLRMFNNVRTMSAITLN